MTQTHREFDVVVWGATGFTGRLTAEYMLEREDREAAQNTDMDLRWAIAGRNAAKLETVLKEISRITGRDASDLPVLVGDGRDATFLDELTQRTRVVATTVGPYAKYGSGLVEACIRNGTHYCDLSGEVHWMQQMIDRHQRAAEKSGARIVFTSGFDCIPSDLGVFFLQREMKRRHGVVCRKIRLRVNGFSGGMSGGTVASMLNMQEEASKNQKVARAMLHPYSLNPEGERAGPDSREPMGVGFDADLGQWTAPFIMSGINTKVVRRTNALLDYAYGRDFRYEESMLTGKGPAGFAKAVAMSAGTAGGMAALSVGPLRRVISERLPEPGEGPTRKEQEAGYFDLLLRGEATDGTVLRARVRGDRDPGYGSTSRMLAESAICLARDTLRVGGGCWTPAAAMGDALLERLPDAGVTFQIQV